MTTTDTVAWIGALTGVAAFALSIWKHFRDGPRIRLSVARDQNRYDGLPSKYIGDYCVVTVSNVGNAPTTITRYVIRCADRFIDYALGWGDIAMLEPGGKDETPFELGPGAVWQSVMLEGTAQVVCSASKYTTACIYTTMSNRCKRIRLYPTAE
jgi:hypothetical protein